MTERYPTTEELLKRTSEAKNENKWYYRIFYPKDKPVCIFWDGKFYQEGGKGEVDRETAIGS